MRTREMEKMETSLAKTLDWGFSIRFHRHFWYLERNCFLSVDIVFCHLAQGPFPKSSSTSTTSLTLEFFLVSLMECSFLALYLGSQQA